MWWVIVLKTRCAGFLGLSIATTHPTTALSKMSPFQIVYGHDPPRLLSYLLCTAKVDVVDRELCARDQLLAAAHDKLLMAQNYMKRVYDKGHREVHF